jgi:hypothetical protein
VHLHDLDKASREKEDLILVLIPRIQLTNMNVVGGCQSSDTITDLQPESNTSCMTRHNTNKQMADELHQETTFSSSSSVFDPSRAMIHFALPKRFYRTFWRSAAQRMLDLHRKGSILD